MAKKRKKKGSKKKATKKKARKKAHKKKKTLTMNELYTLRAKALLKPKNKAALKAYREVIVK
jgi:hypothetical protein